MEKQSKQCTNWQYRLIPGIFLVPVFFTLRSLNESAGLLADVNFISLVFPYLVLTLLTAIAGRLFFKKWIPACCWTILVLSGFFLFGPFQDFLKPFSPNYQLTTYKLLLPLAAGVFLLLTYLFRKQKAEPVQLHRYLTLLYLLLTAIELGRSFYYTFQEPNPALTIKPLEKLPGAPTAIADSLKPDIYLIVLDEYPSSNLLSKKLQFNNSSFDSLLLQNGFYLATNSQSNYNATPLSIASTLNMNYFGEALEGETMSAKLILRSWKTYRQSILPGLLQQQGYEIINYSLENFTDFPSHSFRVSGEMEKNIVFANTIAGRFWKEVMPKLALHLPVKLARAYHRNQAKADRLMADKHLPAFEALCHNLSVSKAQPRFVLVHLLLPHHPYIYYPNNAYRDPNLPALPKTAIAGFLKQLQYTNQLIAKALAARNNSASRPLAILLEGDHGFRHFLGDADRSNQFSNLNAYFFSDGDYSALYPGISPVNSFRIVLNKYFATALPLLPDSTIYLR